VDQVLEKIDGWMRISEPDIVLIHLGNNDLTYGQSLESTIEELRQLIQRIRAVNPRVKLLIAQIIPCGNPARIQQLNQRIGNLARRTNTQSHPSLWSISLVVSTPKQASIPTMAAIPVQWVNRKWPLVGLLP
jgi:lysophospholipase L1-like esterase